jgi:hypothetical protein
MSLPWQNGGFKKVAQSGNWGFTCSYYAKARVTPEGDGLIKAGPANKYEISGMCVPRGPGGQANAAWSARPNGGPGFGCVVSAKTKYPELAVNIIDFLYSDESTVFFNYGIEGVTCQKDANGKMTFLPEWKTAANPVGCKDLGNYGLSFALIPAALNQLLSAVFAGAWSPEVLGYPSYALRGLYIRSLRPQDYLALINSKPKNSYIVPDPWTRAEIVRMLADMGQKP